MMRRALSRSLSSAARSLTTKAIAHQAAGIVSQALHPNKFPVQVSTSLVQSIRSLTTSSNDDPDGIKALAFAKDLIEKNDSEKAIAALSKAAIRDNGEAQYLLGTLLLHDKDADVLDDTASLLADELGDAEASRQHARQEDGPQNVRAIRKSARRAYKEYLKATTKSSTSSSKASTVHHATKTDLDRAFGLTKKELLQPSTSLPPLTHANEGDVDTTKAIEWLRRAAGNGQVEAHIQLGNVCLEEEPPMAAAASEWYIRAVQGNENPHPDALYNLGTMVYNGVEDAEPPLEPDRAAAIPYFVRAAEVGDLSAQFFMGHVLHHGDEDLGIEADLNSALILLESAADKGHGGARYYLAQLYRSGDEQHSFAADRNKFLEYLDAALQAEEGDAYFCMADMYFHGTDGFARDLEQAHQFYLAAAQHGHADAMCCLGSMHYNGVGVEQNYRKAFDFYQEAADRDSLEAWKNLAEMYSFGRGVPASQETADAILKMLQKVEQE